MYQNSVLYKGNIIINKDGTTLVLREGVVLGYDSNRDCFYDVEKVLPYSLSLDLERDKLSKEEIDKYTEIINTNYYSYKVKDNGSYIDGNSITLFKDNKKRK